MQKRKSSPQRAICLYPLGIRRKLEEARYLCDGHDLDNLRIVSNELNRWLENAGAKDFPTPHE
jgi:hypothetical protein